MEVNQIVALLQALQFDQAREQWTLLSKTNTHAGMRGIGAYFYLKDKNYTKALSLIENSFDKYSIFLRSQILLAQKQPMEAMRNLVSIVEDPEVCANEGLIMFMLRTCKKKSVHKQSLEVLTRTILSHFDQNAARVPASVILLITDDLPRDKACSVLARLFKANPDNEYVQARYLDVLVDVDFLKAKEVSASLSKHT